MSGACSYPSCSLEDLALKTYDFAPLWRSSIGFDRLFDLVDAAQRASEDSFPPCNIERVGDDPVPHLPWLWRVSRRTRSSLTAEQNVLTVEGRKGEQKRDFTFRGISSPRVQAAVQPRRPSR